MVETLITDAPGARCGAAARTRFQLMPSRLRAACDTVSLSAPPALRSACSSSAVKGMSTRRCLGPAEPALFTRYVGSRRWRDNPPRGDAGAHLCDISRVERHDTRPVGRQLPFGQQPLARRVELRLVPPHHHHCRAFGQIAPADVLADVTGRAGDQRHLAGESSPRCGVFDGAALLARRLTRRRHEGPRSPQTRPYTIFSVSLSPVAGRA